jgi:HTH-type transcriptional regulator / antitoxin HipB
MYSVSGILSMDYHIKTPEQLKVALRQLRQGRGLNQAEFGRRVGLSQERISAIESHPERITTDQLLTLLMALGTELVIKPRDSPASSLGVW